jgi:hypothetical protein
MWSLGSAMNWFVTIIAKENKNQNPKPKTKPQNYPNPKLVAAPGVGWGGLSPPERTLSPPERMLSPPSRMLSPPERMLSPPERMLSPPWKFSKACKKFFSIGVKIGVGWAQPTRKEISGAASTPNPPNRKPKSPKSKTDSKPKAISKTPKPKGFRVGTCLDQYLPKYITIRFEFGTESDRI